MIRTPILGRRNRPHNGRLQLTRRFALEYARLDVDRFELGYARLDGRATETQGVIQP